jgi:hypothetical protein
MNKETNFQGDKNKKFKTNKKYNKKKFVPEFKKRTPTWKLVDAESKELLPKYDQVIFNFKE